MHIITPNNRIITSAGRIIASSNSFEFVVRVAAGGTFTFPLISGKTYNFVARWGDNASSTITAYNSASRVHTYTNAGDYIIAVDGVMQMFSFAAGGDKLKLIKILNWGNVGCITAEAAFYGCINLVQIPDGPITWPLITSCFRMFRGCSGLTQDIPSRIFEQCPLITTFDSVFHTCTNLGSAGTGIIPENTFKFNTLATTFAYAFSTCSYVKVNSVIFRTNILVTSFYATFTNALLVDSLPEYFYYYNKLVINYSYTHSGRVKIALPDLLFDLASLSIVTTFARFMDGNGANSPTGIIQPIWNYTAAISTIAFKYCFSLTNYAIIPVAWK